MGIGKIFKGLVDIVYPKSCPVCKTRLQESASADMPVCTRCWLKIKKNVPPFCVRCGRHLEKKTFTKNVCPACTRKEFYFDRAFAACTYEGVLKDLIHEFKYKGKDYLGVALCSLLTDYIKEYNLPMEYLDVVIPVPLHGARLREREFNQAQVLALGIGQAFGKPVLPVLVRHRPTRTQTELEPHQRQQNVRNSFRVLSGFAIKEKNALLVDDVLTTGATCSEAARTLKMAGANVVFVLALAN